MKACLIPVGHNNTRHFSRCICFYSEDSVRCSTNGLIIAAPSFEGCYLGERNPIIKLIEVTSETGIRYRE